MQFLYRFRRTEQLLGKDKELERQEIYFPSPEELNDPVEGFKDMFWLGDEIVWKNLIKHYLLCLESICEKFLIDGENFLSHPSTYPYSKRPVTFQRQRIKACIEKSVNCSSRTNWPRNGLSFLRRGRVRLGKTSFMLISGACTHMPLIRYSLYMKITSSCQDGLTTIHSVVLR